MFPLKRIDHRQLEPDYTGLVITCDVDKTYLDTDFHSMKGLMRIPLEWGEDKEAMIGMTPVLKGLRDYGSGLTPLYFITASPPFLFKSLTRKMLLDGVQFDGITFKNWNQLLLKRRKPRWLKLQLPYKLAALFNQCRFLPKGCREILIGDDTEQDALAYSLYAKRVSAEVDDRRLVDAMAMENCPSEAIQDVLTHSRDLVAPLPKVEWIYIYLCMGSDPHDYERFGERLVACHSPFQIAAHLWSKGYLAEEAVLESMRQWIRAAGSPDLSTQIADLHSRGFIDASSITKLKEMQAQANH